MLPERGELFSSTSRRSSAASSATVVWWVGRSTVLTVATARPPAVGRHAAGDQHPGPVGGAAARQLSTQAGLADASLAPQPDDGRFAICGRPRTTSRLLDTADETQARHAAAHLAGIILCDWSQGSPGRRGRRPKDGEPASAEIGNVPDSGRPPPGHAALARPNRWSATSSAVDVTAKGAIDMSNTIRRLWVRLALSGELVTAAVAAATWHTDPILLRIGANHCEPVVRDQ